MLKKFLALGVILFPIVFLLGVFLLPVQKHVTKLSPKPTPTIQHTPIPSAQPTIASSSASLSSPAAMLTPKLKASDEATLNNKKSEIRE